MGFGSGSAPSALIVSSLANEARGSELRCAAGAGRACGGAAEPGALVGNLRVAAWAGFDAFAPIVDVVLFYLISYLEAGKTVIPKS